MRVVWAIQSPTLLNILAQGPWDMQVADFGDAQGLAEVSQLTAPRWDGRPDGVEAVFVCSPLHVENARKHLPKARILLVAHQGYHQKLPACPEARGVVCFSKQIASHIRPASRNVWVLRPSYPVESRWKYFAGKCWTMMSRPGTREPISYAGMDTARQLSKTPIRVYGQEQTDGALDRQQRESMMISCSAYVSVLPPRAGFGLAEHEAMSLGCPVVGAEWGDVAWLRARGGRYPASGFREYGDIFGIAELIDRIAKDERFAREISIEQSAYLREFFPASVRDESIQSFMDTFSDARG